MGPALLGSQVFLKPLLEELGKVYKSVDAPVRGWAVNRE